MRTLSQKSLAHPLSQHMIGSTLPGPLGSKTEASQGVSRARGRQDTHTHTHTHTHTYKQFTKHYYQEQSKEGFSEGGFCKNGLAWLWRSEYQMYCWAQCPWYFLSSWA